MYEIQIGARILSTDDGPELVKIFDYCSYENINLHSGIANYNPGET